MNPITPTVGRVVLFALSNEAHEVPALITRTHSNECVNLHVLHDMKAAEPVREVSYSDPPAGNGGTWRWMPYQKEVAAGKVAPTPHAQPPITPPALSSLEVQDRECAAVSTAPRVTLDSMKARIASEHYFTAGDAASALGQPKVRGSSLDRLTFCVLVLDNGINMTGESACVSPENFNAELGKKLARENALNKMWALEGYLLAERLHKRAAITPSRTPV
jgi:hypothetical protein